MILNNLSIKDIEKEIQELSPLFFQAQQAYAKAFGGGLTQGSMRGSLQEQVTALLSFAKGEFDLSHVEEICNEISDLFWKLPWQQSALVQWQAWEKTVIGFIVRAALSKLKLNNNKDLSGPEVAILANMTIMGVNKATSSGRLESRRDGRQHVYSSEAVKKFIG